MGHHRRKCVIQMQRNNSVGRARFNCYGTFVLEVLYLITMEQQCLKWSISQCNICAGSVFLRCIGTTTLEVFYPIAMEHNHWQCVTLLQWNSGIVSVLFNCSGRAAFVFAQLFQWMLKTSLLQLISDITRHALQHILKQSHDCLLYTKKETNRVLFLQWNMVALLLPHA